MVCVAKVVHTHLMEDRKTVKKFEDECELLNAIRHPNIVQFLGVWKDPASSKKITLLLELMDESLSDFLEK